MPLQPFCPGSIIIEPVKMSITINFYDHFGFNTIKIDDVISNRMLAPEFKVIQLPVAEMCP